LPQQEFIRKVYSGKICQNAFPGKQGTIVMEKKVKTCQPAQKRGLQPSRMSFIFCLLIASVICHAGLTDTATAATYYLDADNGNDSNPGTSELPWKTVAYAQEHVANGDTIYLRNGNYGEVSINRTGLNRTSWDDGVTYMAAPGENPVFDQLTIRGYENRYLTIKDIDITAPSDSDYYAVVDIKDSSYVKIIDCNITGRWDPPDNTSDYGIRINGDNFRVSDVLIDNCDIHHLYRGILLTHDLGSNIIVRNCQVHKTHASQLDLQGDTTAEVIIEYNHLYGRDKANTRAHGSGIAIRISNLTVRGNIIHTYGGSGGIYFYSDGPDGGYENMLIENNLVYDKGGSVGRFEYLKGNITVRNNTFIGTRHEYDPGSDLERTYRYDLAAKFTVYDEEIGASDVSIYNNIFVGAMSLPVGRFTNLNEDNNILWSFNDGNGYLDEPIGSNSILIAKGSGGFNYDENYFEGSGNFFVGGVDFDKYSYSELVTLTGTFVPGANFIVGEVVQQTTGEGVAEGVVESYTGSSDSVVVIWKGSPFFEIAEDDGEDVIGVTSGAKIETIVTKSNAQHRKNLNSAYQLAAGSPAIGFADPDNAPLTDVLGNSRDANPDAGCYEYISAYDPNNSAPVLDSIGDKSVSENSSLIFTVTAADADGDTITYSAAVLPDGADFSDQIFSWTPGYDQTGSYDITFTASDGTDQDTETVTITVSNLNRAPVLAAIGNQSVSENTLLTFDVTSTDTDGDTITYSMTGLNPSVKATFTDQTFNWTPKQNDVGTHQVTFAASDGQTTDSETIAIIVINVNTEPILVSIGDKSVNENTPMSISISATDPDGDAVDYSADNLPTGAAFFNQTFTWTPGYAHAGTHQVTFIASDGQLQDSETISIAVGNSNRPPVLSSIGDKSVLVDDLLTFTVSASDPDGEAITYSMSGLHQSTKATFSGQTFNWTPKKNHAGAHQVTFIASDGQSQDSETITITVNDVDTSPPTVAVSSPMVDSIQAPTNSLIRLSILDDDTGVDSSTVTIEVDGDIVYTGDKSHHKSSNGDFRRMGPRSAYKFFYQADNTFEYDEAIEVKVNASDVAGNPMTEYSYSFHTEMRSFGRNKAVNSDSNNDNEGIAATACDSGGNIWTVWHKGKNGSRDVYIGKLTDGADNFGSRVNITNIDSDQVNPVIAIDSADKIYVTWQDNRNGEWDIYVSTSTDGSSWSAARKITDPNSDQVNPDMALDSSGKAYIVWEDDSNNNSDIYIASSSNGFLSKSTSQITYNEANQSSPAIAVDSAMTVYVVWEDARAGAGDIYGADSSVGPWTNVAIVTNGGNQTTPAISAESTGTILHLLWVDDSPGDKDIYYASSSGLPGSPLSGSTIIDDTTNAVQSAPAIIAAGTTGTDLKLFACWQDQRNISAGNNDTDIYFRQLNAGSGTNILVGDDSTNSWQSDPAMSIDGYGYPYTIWSDGRNKNAKIYYSGSRFVESEPFTSGNVIASSGATVGTNPASIIDNEDVSVTIPAFAQPVDAKITISRVKNPQKFSSASLCLSEQYEFGPSGMQFDSPVTVTIPFDAAGPGVSASAFWYNPLTGTYSQQGITNIGIVVISPTLHALRFKTTHFTQFVIGGGGGIGGIGGGGGGGGGCSLSTSGKGSIFEFLLPYIVLTVVMALIKYRDKKYRNRDRNLKRIT